MESMDREPRYVISVAARMCGVRSYTLRYYEKIGIIEPSRSEGNIRLYSDEDIAKIKQMKTLMEDLGITIAGAEVILRMAQRITELQKRVEYIEIENNRLRNSSNI
ncbi:MAG: MerR family transcriptional regulator [Dehalococcoidales bacterium]|nr:MAG: MerR family transcriptional regulator [Dehalococcoidales bacterium]